MKQKPSMNPGFFQQQVQTQRQVVHDRIARETAETQRVKELQDRASKENQQFRRRIAARDPDLSPQTRLINIPTGLSHLSAPPETRIEKYTEHLKQNIRKSAQLSDASELTDFIELKARKKSVAVERKLDGQPELRIISDQLCSTCKGGCCVLGNDHAFNTVSTMRRFMDANPTLTEEEVLDAYLGRIESETVEDSCINQTKTGCGLPREMRSDTCNGYYCDEIKDYHREFSDPNIEVKKLIAVQRAHHLWDRWTPDSDHGVVAVHLVDTRKVDPIDLSKP